MWLVFKPNEDIQWSNQYCDQTYYTKLLFTGRMVLSAHVWAKTLYFRRTANIMYHWELNITLIPQTIKQSIYVGGLGCFLNKEKLWKDIQG